MVKRKFRGSICQTFLKLANDNTFISTDDESCSADDPLSMSCMKPLSLDEKIQIQLKVLEDLKTLKGFSEDIPQMIETSQTVNQDTNSLWKDISDDHYCQNPFYHFPKQLHFCLEPD